MQRHPAFGTASDGKFGFNFLYTTAILFSHEKGVDNG
jgi:hypothetical protein